MSLFDSHRNHDKGKRHFKHPISRACQPRTPGAWAAGLLGWRLPAAPTLAPANRPDAAEFMHCRPAAAQPATPGIVNPTRAAASATVNKLFCEYLTTASGVGPTLNQTGPALFNTTDGNYTSPGAAPDLAGLNVARKSLRKMTDPVTARRLNIPLRYLVDPPEVEGTLRVLVAADRIEGSTENVEVVIEAELSDATNGTTGQGRINQPDHAVLAAECPGAFPDTGVYDYEAFIELPSRSAMIHIDTRLEKAVVLAGSFIPVLSSIEAATPCGLPRYVEYLLDDSIVPTTVRKTFQPEGIAPDQDWQSVVPYYKLLLFRQGLLDSTSQPAAVDDYREHPFDRLAELRQEPYSACRLQIKDDIVRELVRAYIEGQLASSEARAQGQSESMAQLVDDYSRKGCVNTRVKKRLFPSVGASSLITFFMLVTDRDVLIADHAISSYQLLKNLDFKLVVYCNWISPENRGKYFDKWRSLYPFLEILVPEWMTEATRPATRQGYGYGVEGPYERCEVPWDRELPLLKSEHYATVDADFEILSPGFVSTVVGALASAETVGFIGTDGTHDVVLNNSDYDGKNILKSRIDTWCVAYRRATSACGVSHMYYHEPAEDGEFVLTVWDSSALRQMALRSIHGYSGSPLPSGFFNQYIHYAAFSKNRHIDETNIGMYRQLMILAKIGHPHLMDPQNYLDCGNQLKGLLSQVAVPYPDSAGVSQLAQMLYSKLFSHVDQSNPYKI